MGGPLCPDCMREVHKGLSCRDYADRIEFGGGPKAPLCPVCKRNHSRKVECPLRSREEEARYRAVVRGPGMR